MKTKILSIFAAAALSLGGVAVTNTANASLSPAVVTSSPTSNQASNQATEGVQLAHFRGFRHRHGRRFGRGLRHRRMCRRLYILGFRHGNWRARRAFYRHCTRRSYRPRWY
jgi:hypothetical protein